MLKPTRMTFIVFALASLLYTSFSGLPVTPGLSVSAGASMTDQLSYGSAVGGACAIGAELRVGDARGALFAYRIAYQAPTGYSADWYRYRGFSGMDMGAGYFGRIGPVAAYLLGGGQLAKYDTSYSYFWFPFVEAGGTLPVATLGDRLLVEVGVSVPVYFRADAFTAGARAVARFSFAPRTGQAAGGGR